MDVPHSFRSALFSEARLCWYEVSRENSSRNNRRIERPERIPRHEDELNSVADNAEVKLRDTGEKLRAMERSIAKNLHTRDELDQREKKEAEELKQLRDHLEEISGSAGIPGREAVITRALYDTHTRQLNNFRPEFSFAPGLYAIQWIELCVQLREDLANGPRSLEREAMIRADLDTLGTLDSLPTPTRVKHLAELRERHYRPDPAVLELRRQIREEEEEEEKNRENQRKLDGQE